MEEAFRADVFTELDLWESCLQAHASNDLCLHAWICLATVMKKLHLVVFLGELLGAKVRNTQREEVWSLYKTVFILFSLILLVSF